MSIKGKNEFEETQDKENGKGKDPLQVAIKLDEVWKIIKISLKDMEAKATKM